MQTTLNVPALTNGNPLSSNSDVNASRKSELLETTLSFF